MIENKITPFIWFSAKKGIEPILTYYRAVFEDDFQMGGIMELGKTPNGRGETCEVKIFGQPYILMSTETLNAPLNNSLSLVLQCTDQQEIDRYWDYFTKEGEAFQCGWCMDLYRLRWQVLPKNLRDLLSKPNANQILMGQQKIIIKEFLK